MDITTVFLEALMPLATALYVIGMFLKGTKAIEDRYIPIILMCLGIAGAFGLMPIQDKSSITDAIIQGVLSAGMAVIVNQLYKQSKPD